MTSKTNAKPMTDPILLTPTQFKTRQKEFLVIDVRGWLEYWMAHILGAKRLSRDRVLKTVPKDQAIIAMTCLSGHRSAMAAQWLVGQGYENVHNLKGGLLGWQGAGYAVHRGNRP
jgi:rhodanese-related sulfurtransferase